MFYIKTHPLPGLLSQINRSWYRHISDDLRSYELTEATWLPLVRINRASNPPNQTEFALVMGLEDFAAARLLDQLEAKGLVEHQVTSDDLGDYRVTLTDRGREIAAKAEEAAEKIRRKVLSEISDDDMATTMWTLNGIAKSLEEHLEYRKIAR